MRKMVLVLIVLLCTMSLFADGADTQDGAPQIATLPFTDTGDVSDDTDGNGLRGEDEWWVLTTTISLTNLDIHPVYDGWDGYLYIYDTDLNVLQFDDDGPAGGGDSQVIMDLAAGSTIYICVDEYGTGTTGSTYTLNVSADQTGSINDESAPTMITNAVPASGSSDVSINPTLTWDFGANTETYDLYFDTVNPPVNQVVTDGVADVSGSYTPDTALIEFTTYYWKVVCHNSTSPNSSESSLSFTTEDLSTGHITNPTPEDAAYNVALDQVLTWDFADNAETYDLFFDTVTPPVTQVITDGVVSGQGSYTPTSMVEGVTYYWKVVSKNSQSIRHTEDEMYFDTFLGADGVAIGNDRYLNQGLPIDPFFGYTYSQTIYLQSEIDVTGRRVEKISYLYNQHSAMVNNNEWVIYMAHTSETEYSSTTSWLPIDQFTEVYNGPLPTIGTDGWVEFTLTTPFVYNNTDNLVVAVEENQPEYASGSDDFYATDVTGDRSIVARNDSNNPDPNAPPTGTLKAYVPNTRLTFGDIAAQAELTINPESIEFGTVFMDTATAPVNISLMNTGGSAMNIQSVVVDDDVNFTLNDANTYPNTLGSAENMSLEVVFNPTTEGAISGVITVTDDLRQTHQITLTGEGFNATISSFPYTQSFDTDALPMGWVVDPVVSGDSWELYQTQLDDHGADNEATGNGGYYMGVDDSSPDTIPSHLYTPVFNLTDLTNPVLTFNYWIGDNDNTSELHIDALIGTETTTDVVVITDADGATGWAYVEVALADFAGQNVSFDFRAMESDSFYGDICIDDISIYDNSTVPAPTTLVAPVDTATGILSDGTLEWNTAMGASGYYVSLGTDNPPTDVYNAEDVDALELAYSDLQHGVDYYWQVVPYNVNGSAENCPVWSFTTFNEVPNPANIDEPTDGAISVLDTPELSWEDGGNYPEGYKLYLGSDNPPTDIINGDDLGDVTSYTVTTALTYEATYYWQVVPYNFAGDATDCPVWSFTVMSDPNFGGDGNLYGGYYFANSTDNGNGLGSQPIFEWIDISTTGQTVTYSSEDDGFATVDLGFTFNYFGVDYDQIHLGTNGYATFGTTSTITGGSMSIPNDGNPNNIIAMVAMDLHTTNVPSNCYYGADEMGNFVYTVEMWNDFGDSDEYIDAQLILYPTGKIKIQYRNYTNPGGDTGSSSILGDAVIGIENAAGTVGVQYRKDGVGGPLEDDMAIAFATTTSELSDAGDGLYLPSEIDFDIVTVDENSVDTEVRLRNFTTDDIVLASAPAVSGDNADQFALTDNNTYPLTIASGSEAIISVQFNPTTIGHKNAVLTIEDDYTVEERNVYEIPLHGYGFLADDNDASSDATEIALYDGNIEGMEAIIQPETDIDWYVFWQEAPAQIQLHTENIYDSNIDLAAFVYGPYDDINVTIDEATSVAFGDNEHTDGVNPAITYDIPADASGFYYVRIARADNSPAADEARNMRWTTGDYALWLSTDNPVPPAGLTPPTGLTHNITYQGVELSWLAPTADSRDIVGYNVYRDDVVVNTEAVSGEFFLDTDVVVGTTYQYKITALYRAPTGESEPSSSIQVTHVHVDAPVIAEGFESYDDFSTEMGLMVNLDNDGEDTYGFNNGIDFPNENNPMAYIVFNPLATTPPVQGADAYTGSKYAACFAADTNANDDWLMTPQIQLSDEEATLQFMARSYTTQFGSELVEVAISAGSADPDDFTVISGDEPIQLPGEWTQYSYQLNDYAGQVIRVAIHTVSQQTFFALFDDIMVVNNGATVDANDQVIIPETTTLRGNYPNPFNPTTSISFDLQKNSDVTIDIYNLLGQRVSRVVKANFNAGRHSVVWNGDDESGQSVASGVYFYKMTSGDYSQTKKMMLMK